MTECINYEGKMVPMQTENDTLKKMMNQIQSQNDDQKQKIDKLE